MSHIHRRSPIAPPAFTIPEMMIALALLGVASVMVIQVGFWTLQERNQATEAQAVQERAANLLEQARALDWDRLNSEWAKNQKLPKEEQQRGWTLRVTVADVPKLPSLKRVTVGIDWKAYGNQVRKVELVGLFTQRPAESKGGK